MTSGEPAAGPARRRTGAQELVDEFVMKLRAVRFLRTSQYDQLFRGDSTWVTETLAGGGPDGRREESG